MTIDQRQRSTPRLIIFDCDGVLVDSEKISIQIDQQILSEHGWDLPLDEIVDRFVGTSSNYVRETLEQVTGRSAIPNWDAELHRRHAEAFSRELRPVTGIEKVLEHTQNYEICIASSSPVSRILQSLELCGLLKYFRNDRIFSASMVEKGKPAPDLFLHAATVMQRSPQECLVIEDSIYGAKAARAAGMKCLGFVGGLTRPGSLAAEGAEEFSSMNCLASYLRRLIA